MSTKKELKCRVAVYDGSDNWLQNFVWNDEVDGIQMLEQKDVLDYDTDGNTTELTRSYYHRNALGSVMEITDANQAAVASYRYDPYGSVTITRGGQTQSSDPLGQHWGFTRSRGFATTERATTTRRRGGSWSGTRWGTRRDPVCSNTWVQTP